MNINKTSIQYLKTLENYGDGANVRYLSESTQPVVDIDKEFFKLAAFKRFEGYEANAAVGKLGRPFVVFIGTQADLENLVTGNWGDLKLRWSTSTDANGNYSVTIPFGSFEDSSTGLKVVGHQKGVINVVGYTENPNPSSNPDPTPNNSTSNLVVPRVRTFVKVGSSSQPDSFEEVYDSPVVNIRNGSITVYSQMNTLRMVLVY